MNKSKKWMAISAGSLLVAALSTIFTSKSSENKKRVVYSSKRLEHAVNSTVGEDKKTLEEIKQVLQKQLDKVNKRIEELS